jgi:hypothetical protein
MTDIISDRDPACANAITSMTCSDFQGLKEGTALGRQQ